MADDRPRMEKLTGKENWSMWCFVVKTITECDGTLDVCAGLQPKPVLGASDYDEDMGRWSKSNLKVKKLLVLSLDIEPLLRVEGCETV